MKDYNRYSNVFNMLHVIVIPCMGMSGLPDMSTQSPRAAGSRARAEVNISGEPRMYMVLYAIFP